MENLLSVEGAYGRSSLPDWPCRLTENTDIQGRNIDLILRNSKGEKRINVFMKLFGQCPKHYIELYRTRECKHQFGHFNSAQCMVSRVPENSAQFMVSQTNDENGLLFESSCASEADEFIRMFRCLSFCPYSPRNRRASRIKNSLNK